MLSKSFLSIVLVALFVTLTIAWRKTDSPSRIASRQMPQQAGIKVLLDQLPAIQGVVPVEILRPSVSSNAPNQVEDVTYVVRNNMDKAISALAVRKTVVYMQGGRVSTLSTCSTSDYAFHPDVSGPRLFGPHTEESMDSAGPMRFEDDVTVKEVRLQVDYVLFENKTVIGKGSEGEKKIDSMRLGARKYKAWLVQRYARSGKSLVAILPLLQADHVPGGLDLDDIDQTLGAERYRLHLLKKFQTAGASEVEAYLNR